MKQHFEVPVRQVATKAATHVNCSSWICSDMQQWYEWDAESAVSCEWIMSAESADRWTPQTSQQWNIPAGTKIEEGVAIVCCSLDLKTRPRFMAYLQMLWSSSQSPLLRVCITLYLILSSTCLPWQPISCGSTPFRTRDKCHEPCLVLCSYCRSTCYWNGLVWPASANHVLESLLASQNIDHQVRCLWIGSHDRRPTPVDWCHGLSAANVALTHRLDL